MRAAFGRSDSAALGLLGVAWLALAWPVLVGGEVLFRGEIHEVLYPFHRFLAEELAAGRAFPLWNPYAFFGYPWVAAPQAGAFYPLNWLLPLVSATEVALSWAIFGHLALASLLMYGFARVSLDLRAPASLVAAAIYGLNGHMLGNVEQLHNHATLAWAPLVLLAIERATRAEAPARSVYRWCGAGALAFGLSALGGMTQQTLYLSVLFAAWWAFRCVRCGRSRALFVGAAIFGLGTLLFSVQLLPTLELLGLSARSLATGADALADGSGSLGLADLLAFAVPNADPEWAKYGWQAANTVFVGVLPLALVAGLLASKEGRARSGHRFFAVMLALALCFGLGANNPLVVALHGLPGMSLFRDPSRVVSLVLLAVAVLAGAGLEGGLRIWRRSAWVGLALAGVVAVSMLLGRPPRRAIAFELAMPSVTVLVAATVGLAVLAAALLLRAPDRQRVAWVLAVLVLVALIGGGRGLIVTSPAPLEQPVARGALASLPELVGSDRLLRTDREDVLIEPFENPVRVRSASGFSSLIPLHVLRFTCGEGAIDALRLQACRDFLASDGRRAIAGLRYHAKRDVRGQLVLTRDRSAFPRAFLLDGPPGDPDELPDASFRVSFITDRPDRVVLELPPADASWLVLSDTWYPGWQARVDGRRVEIEPVFEAFRGVRLPSGAREVEFRYRPRSVYLGLGFSVLGLLGVVTLVSGRAARRNGRGAPGESGPGLRSPGSAPA